MDSPKLPSSNKPDSIPQTFSATVVCMDGQEIPKLVTRLQLEESCGVILLQTSEMLDLLQAKAKTLRRSADESWEILNPRKSGTVLEFQIRKIRKEVQIHVVERNKKV